MSKDIVWVDERAAFEAIDWLDDFVARCNGDDRGACESVNIVRTALQARAALTASAQSVPDEWIAVGTLARNSREKIVFSPICDLHVFDGMSVYAPAPGKGGAE